MKEKRVKFVVLLIINIVMITIFTNTNFTNVEIRDVSLGLIISLGLVTIWYKLYYL